MTDEERNRPPITVGEAQAILANCPTVDGVSPEDFYFKPGGNEVKYKNKKYNRPSIMGTWPDFLRVNNQNITAGRFLSDADERFRTMVCVIGGDMANVLFEGDDPIGKPLRVNGDQFEVIGVLEEIKSTFGNDQMNGSVIMPLSTFMKIHPWEKELFLAARANSISNIDQAEEEIIGVLRMYRKVPFSKDNNFALSTQQQFKDFIANITKYIYLAMIVITSVGLMVGGIGVMNIMLVSVTERTREIGILFGVSLGLIVNLLLKFPITVPFFWIFLGFFVAVSVGLVSGMYPAIKASRLDPIEALRYE